MIMEHIMTANWLSIDEKKAFNKCRIYLQVSRISDICTADGLYITEAAWKGDKLEHKSEYNWPIIDRPKKSGWNIWRTVLKKSGICQLDNNRLLSSSLGIWRTYPKTWEWFLDSKQNLIKKVGNHYEVHEVAQGRTRQKRYQLQGKRTPNSTNYSLSPTTIQYEGNCIIQEGSQAIQIQTKDKEETGNLNFTEKEKCDLDILKYHILQGTAIAVSDGSCYKDDDVGTAAWIITSSCKQHDVQGSTISPGTSGTYNSYRSELSGVICILDKLHQICGKLNIKKEQSLLHVTT